MALKEFQEQLSDYLARVRGASHDARRSYFMELTRQGFDVKPLEVELEKGLKGVQVRGFIDALYQDIVFEFKRDLKTERDKGKEELGRYLRSLGAGQICFGVLTDGLLFEVYILRDGRLDKIDEANLERLSAQDAFLWFDSFLFSQRAIAPTPQDIVRRLGDASAVFHSSFQRLSRMLAQAREHPSCQVKYGEWDKLLAKVYGHSVARPDLFLRHTYLSLLVKLLAYVSLFRRQPQGQELREVAMGKAFTNLPNLAEEDFFCWVLAPGLEAEALELLRGIAQHLAVYDLSLVDQDLLKELYENLVDKETKHDLGEVYTPDWLVELSLKEAGFKKGQSLLDPACGSGTFLFIAIRLLREQGLQGPDLVDEALKNIVGVDVHPLAVTISKVNYVLALAEDLRGYPRAVVLPIYMADSLQAVEPTNIGALISIRAGQKKDEVFVLPGAMAQTPEALDKAIEEMRGFAEREEAGADGFSAYLKSQGLEGHAHLWRPNLRLMRKFIKEGRDTIWAFILKNYYRPAYLRYRPFDLVAGNPPWLAYRYISDPQYQKQIKNLTSPLTGYGLLTKKDVKLFTHLEMATVFFALSADVYLKKGGAIAFVMPRSVLTGAKQHARFQDMLQGKMIPTLALEKALDLGDPEAGGVKPLFKVGSCVLIAQRDAPMPERALRLALSGVLPAQNLALTEARKHLTIKRQRLAPDKLFPLAPNPSPYLKDIKEGATIVPRSFWFVQPVTSPYGIDRERPALETDSEVARTAKRPWQNIRLQAQVESQYLYATLLSRQLLPFGYTQLSLAALPLEEAPLGLRLVRKEAALEKGHRGLHAWLSQAGAEWEKKAKKGRIKDVYERLDYMSLLTSQHLRGYYTILYTADATNLAAWVLHTKAELFCAGIKAAGFIVQHKTFLYQTKVAEEAHYLSAFLNAPFVNQAIKRHQARGAWGERAISRLPFEYVPIPRFDPKNEAHLRLAEVSKACHEKVTTLAPSLKGKGIGRLRGQVRQALHSELGEIDRLVRQILSV